ncbi:MAG: hypothetical protein BWZ07_02496 [Alphaproteobacteria bacterium ADurb.BinA280]|nr:MAG: hypothetical protein BWZ07_02496 [Alphaproteobacteria bacterium ADurb.BinA280]
MVELPETLAVTAAVGTQIRHQGSNDVGGFDTVDRQHFITGIDCGICACEDQPSIRDQHYGEWQFVGAFQKHTFRGTLLIEHICPGMPTANACRHFGRGEMHFADASGRISAVFKAL